MSLLPVKFTPQQFPKVNSQELGSGFTYSYIGTFEQ